MQNKTPLFSLGQVVATPGAVGALSDAGVAFESLLDRHVTGDWGDVSEDDAKENNYAIENDLRILSAYNLSTGEKVWIITEADRSATTFLLPEEY